jgi:hypothetical protein
MKEAEPGGKKTNLGSGGKNFGVEIKRARKNL